MIDTLKRTVKSRIARAEWGRFGAKSCEHMIGEGRKARKRESKAVASNSGCVLASLIILRKNIEA